MAGDRLSLAKWSKVSRYLLQSVLHPNPKPSLTLIILLTFLYNDIVHVLENTIDSCINSATDRFLQCRFTKFIEITQCNGHYAVQGHSRSFKVTDFGTNRKLI